MKSEFLHFPKNEFLEELDDIQEAMENQNEAILLCARTMKETNELLSRFILALGAVNNLLIHMQDEKGGA